jgi:hypothetical protein
MREPDDDPSVISSSFLNEYALGKNADIFPEGAGRLIKAGTKINFNLHLHSIGEETAANVQLGLQFYPKGYVPKYIETTAGVGNSGEREIDIPPNTDNVRTDGYTVLTQPVRLLSFQPHMHNRGKAMCMEAIYPDIRADSARPGPARTETINCVSNYQFGWHITYPYADDVAPILPAGTIIHVTSWHDNTPANKYNPNPRNWVGYGQRTIDEMSFAWVSLFYIDEADYQQRIAARKKTND